MGVSRHFHMLSIVRKNLLLPGSGIDSLFGAPDVCISWSIVVASKYRDVGGPALLGFADMSRSLGFHGSEMVNMEDR